MTAYMTVDIEVTDAEGYEDYKKLSPPAVAAYCGKFVAHGGRPEVLEDDWTPSDL